MVEVEHLEEEGRAPAGLEEEAEGSACWTAPAARAEVHQRKSGAPPLSPLSVVWDVGEWPSWNPIYSLPCPAGLNFSFSRDQLWMRSERFSSAYLRFCALRQRSTPNRNA